MTKPKIWRCEECKTEYERGMTICENKDIGSKSGWAVDHLKLKESMTNQELKNIQNEDEMSRLDLLYGESYNMICDKLIDSIKAKFPKND